jgi:hypothetical protein
VAYSNITAAPHEYFYHKACKQLLWNTPKHLSSVVCDPSFDSPMLVSAGSSALVLITWETPKRSMYARAVVIHPKTM